MQQIVIITTIFCVGFIFGYIFNTIKRKKPKNKWYLKPKIKTIKK